MAVATEREFGLFINGEPPSLPAATSRVRGAGDREPLAKVASTDDVDRAVDAARAALEGDWGRTPHRALAAPARARRRDPGEPKRLAELEARNVGKAISSVKAEPNQGVENFRFYASAIASIAGRSNPMGGSLLFYSLKEPSASPGRSSRGTTR